MQIHEAAYSQNTFNFNEKSVTVKQMFKMIEKEGKYTLFYRLDQVKLDQKVDVDVKNASIGDVLAQVLTNQPLDFKVMDDNVVVIKPVDKKAEADVTITGVVSDATGETLPGVTVQVKGTTIAVSTDIQGKYSISSPDPNATLVFSFVGFIRREVATNNQTVLNVTLTAESKILNEVVVVGYTTQKKKDLTGAVTVVNVSDMTKTPSGNAESLLQGQAAGVSVVSSGQPGQNPDINIRGVNSFGTNTPLYVVDGLPTPDIGTLNPNDIESMQVLKDAGSASIYGVRANNGVIIITTKKGKGAVRIDYNGYYGAQVPPGGNPWGLLNAQQNADMKLLALKQSGRKSFSDQEYTLSPDGNSYILPDYIQPAGAHFGDPSVDPSLYYVNPNYTDPSDYNTFYRIVQANKTGTDWFHELFKTAPIQNHNIALSSGNDQGSYLFSLNYYNQQGTLIDTYDKRYNFRANSQYNINKNLRIGENITYTVTDNPETSLNNPDGVIAMIFREQPIIPVYDIKGNYAGGDGPGLGDAANPVAIQERTKNDKFLGYRLFGNLYADLDLFKYVTLHSSFGGELNNETYHSFSYPTYENAENSLSNQYNAGSSSNYDYTWTNTVTYHQAIGKNDIKLLAGTEANRNGGSGVSGTRQGFYSFDPDYVSLSTGSGSYSTDSYHSLPRSLFSYIGRLDYAFDDKYLLSATIRRDGSTAFINNYGWFPGVSAGWRISQESFMKNIKWITDLKIRAGYGLMGNQVNIDPANQFTQFSTSLQQSYYPLNGSTLAPGFYENFLGNPSAVWERDANANIGIDGTFFNDMISVTVDYYTKKITDLLFSPQLVGTAGVPAPPAVNIGAMKNYGIDASVTGNFRINKDLKFDATLSLTTYTNKILTVTNDIDYFDDDFGRRVGTNLVRNEVGHSVGEFFGYQIAGLWNSAQQIATADAKAQKATGNPAAIYEQDEGVGRFRYADVNGDGRITDADRTFLGNPNPKFSSGLNLGVNYKNFDFSIFLYGVYGNKIWNNVKYWTDFYSSFDTDKSLTALYDSWTPDNKDATAPRQQLKSYFSTNGVANSYFVENGSYLRAKNMVLGYTFSPKLLTKAGIKKLRVYVSGANVFTITSYKGLDPELPGASTTDFGVDEGTYPNSRTYLVGVDLSL
jgi:TonB-linked SusC/RagA family outer membrane protein